MKENDFSKVGKFVYFGTPTDEARNDGLIQLWHLGIYRYCPDCDNVVICFIVLIQKSELAFECIECHSSWLGLNP
jgi:hypothetical protein